MEFQSFLEHAQNPEWWQSQSVVYCISDEYPLLFFSTLIERLKRLNMGNVQALDLTEAPIDSTSAQLATSFLGNRTLYWLKDIANLDAKKRAYWLAYAGKYQGPNCLLLVYDKNITAKDRVQIPCELEQSWCSSVLKFLNVTDTRRNTLLLRGIFKCRKKIALDSLCLLAHYLEVADSEFDVFLTEWLDVIVVPDSSLFDLSKYFFARNPEQFFRVWHKLSSMYGDIFWISYWSDILWRAYHFSRLSTLGYHADAKKIGVRLPFSFMQGGWRQVSLSELKHGLNYMYALDLDLKNGVQGSQFIELFYLKFFLRQFDSKEHALERVK